MPHNSSECPKIHRPGNCVNHEFEWNHTAICKEVTELCSYWINGETSWKLPAKKYGTIKDKLTRVLSLYNTHVGDSQFSNSRSHILLPRMPLKQLHLYFDFAFPSNSYQLWIKKVKYYLTLVILHHRTVAGVYPTVKLELNQHHIKIV